MNIRKIVFYLLLIIYGCSSGPGKNYQTKDELPVIYPDYTGLSIPYNIAPLNFKINEKGDDYYVEISNEAGDKIEISQEDGIVKIPESKWKDLLENSKGESLTYSVYVKKGNKWTKYKEFSNRVMSDPIDPFLYYRLLYPSFQKYKDIRIVQRSMESFSEHYIVNNDAIKHNCANCHSFNRNNPKDFLIHVRGNLGGTFFLKEDGMKKYNLKTKEMTGGAVYPRWHPSGDYVAFSSNKVIQHFHTISKKRIEVVDLASSLLLYDVNRNEIMKIPVDSAKQFMDTYPEWSPDGKYLYFCRAPKINQKKYDYESIKYNLYRVPFDPATRKFGSVQLVFDAAANGMSVSMPRVSPDGKHLVITYHNYGCFPIWHKEADLYMINLDDFSVSRMNINSDFTDSYHTWSANNRWMIFSSKRGDGLTARPYITYVDEEGRTTKPFVLPQKDPLFYTYFVKTFNVPELAEADVWLTPGQLKEVAYSDAIQAKWSDNN
jgi:Tol biopolymer transport system component